MRYRALAINMAVSAVFGVAAMVGTGLAAEPQAKAAENSAGLPAGVTFKSTSASTSARGSTACTIATGNLVLNSSADHVFFIGTDQRVYNFWWNTASNKYQLDALGPAQIAAGNPVLNSSADHVFFIGTDRRVYNYSLLSKLAEVDPGRTRERSRFEQF